MILYIENSKASTKKLLELISKFGILIKFQKYFYVGNRIQISFQIHEHLAHKK
jgi:hypothetical protein